MSTLTTSILTTKGAELVFALPLLFVSLTLTFTGTYLMLDKTRAFPTLGDPEDPYILDIPGTFLDRERSREQETGIDWEKATFEPGVPKTNPRFARLIRSSKRKVKLWRLGGGVGGLLAGYLFGVSSTTLLTLYITEHTSHSMSKIPFLIIVFLVATACSFVGGRFHVAAIIGGSISGSFSIATFAAFAVSLSTVGLLSIWASLAVILLIIPVASLFTSTGRLYASLRWSMRVATAAFGSMGVAFSVAVLAHVPGWEDCLTALWAIHPEKGSTLALSIMGWLLFVIGIGTDWILYRILGPSQDQSWDNYLAHYLDNLPNRAGKFQRLPSFWSRLKSVFHKSHESLRGSLASSRVDEESIPSHLGLVPKNPKMRRPRKAAPAVRFDLAAGFSSDSDSETEVVHAISQKGVKANPMKTDETDRASDSTLLGSGANSEIAKKKNSDDWTIEKYEAEANITSNLLPPNDRLTDWKPTFLSKALDDKLTKAHDHE